jgi:hypothetical protein
MIPLDHEIWPSLMGGYRIPYDASVALRELERTDHPEAVWEELWNELHHQGDVGPASYAALPHIVRIARSRSFTDWNAYAIASVIEASRQSGHNPAIPDWLQDSYKAAWQELLEMGLEQLKVETDETTTRAMLGAVALARGLSRLGRLLSDLDASEIDELYDDRYGAGV